MWVCLLQLNFQQELDPSTKYLPERDCGNVSISGRHCLEMFVHTFSIFKQRGPEKHSCARAAETFCLKYLLCSVTLRILKIPQTIFWRRKITNKTLVSHSDWVCTKDLMGYTFMLLSRWENGLVIPGILRGLKSQDLEAELGSMRLKELRLWRALQILQDPNSIQVLLILPHFTFPDGPICL